MDNLGDTSTLVDVTAKESHDLFSNQKNNIPKKEDEKKEQQIRIIELEKARMTTSLNSKALLI